MMKRYLFATIVYSLICISVNAQIEGAQKDNNDKWGFVDASGNWVVKPIYSEATWNKNERLGYFSKNSSNDTKGCVDEKGRVIIPDGKYVRIEKYDNGYIEVIDPNDRKGLYSMSGKQTIPCKFKMWWYADEEKKYLLVTGDNDKQGIYTNDGKQIVPYKYKSLYYLDDLFMVTDDNEKQGAYTKDGMQIIPCKYKGVGPLFDDTSIIYVFDENHKCGAYSKDGKEILRCEYSSCWSAAEDILVVSIGGKVVEGKGLKGAKYGYYSKDGRELIPCIYDEASKFINDVAKVKKDGEVKLIKNPLKDAAQIKIVENTSVSYKKKRGPVVSRYPKPDSDVDTNIPVAKKQAETTFAFIICNENYADAPVPYSLNDGRILREYCQKALGLPEKNINMYEDATFGNIITAVEKMKSIADAYDGDASIIFYYAGHGFPDDKQSTAYLLPIDGDASSITTTGYSLAKLYKEIASMKLKSCVVFLDACFSGAKREDQMLASSRGVAIKVKEEAPQGKMVVFSAAQGYETAHQLEDKHHGLFTYYLLKQLQATQGEADLGTLTDNVTKLVKRQSVVINNKKQTPTVIPSQTLQSTWRTMKLK